MGTTADNLNFHPTYPIIPGEFIVLTFPRCTEVASQLAWCPVVVFLDGIGAEIAEELTKRVMILDGAMGTMIQQRKLEEEDFRGKKKIYILLTR